MMQNPFEDLRSDIQELKETVLSLRTTIPNFPKEETIDRSELCKRLGITEGTAITHGRKGKIPEMRIGKTVRYFWPDVVKSLSKR